MSDPENWKDESATAVSSLNDVMAAALAIAVAVLLSVSAVHADPLDGITVADVGTGGPLLRPLV